MIKFKFVDTSNGYGVEYDGKVIYDCKNRTKGFAWQEAVSYCSSYQGEVLEDCTYRKLKSFKYLTDLPTAKEVRKKLEEEQGADVRLRPLSYHLEYTVYDVEVWGRELPKQEIENIWRAM